MNPGLLQWMVIDLLQRTQKTFKMQLLHILLGKVGIVSVNYVHMWDKIMCDQRLTVIVFF